MKMEVLAVQQQFQTQFSGLGSNKYRDWTSTLTPPLSAMINMNTTTTTTNTAASVATSTSPAITIKNSTNNSINNASSTPYHIHHHHHNYHHHHRQSTATIINNNKMKNSINNKKTNRQNSSISSSATATTTAIDASSITSPVNNDIVATKQQQQRSTSKSTSSSATITTTNSNNFIYCDINDIDAAAVNELSLRLLDELRAAKSRHLTCTEVSLPCDLTPSIAAEIIRVSEKEPCGIRGCTIYIEFEDEPNNSRRIASLKLDPETVSTFEVYLTLRQDHRGWASLLPQFMKSLARTITISPEFTITKHKLYSPQQRLSYTTSTTGTTSSGGSFTTTTAGSSSAAISTPSS